MKKLCTVLMLFSMAMLFGCDIGPTAPGAVTVSGGPSVSGTASEGNALPVGTTVTLTDANKTQVTALVGDNGTYSIPLTGLSAPYLLDAGPYYSFASGPGTTDINPLTTLCMEIALGTPTIANDKITLPANFATAFTSAAHQLNTALSQQYSANVPATQQDFLNGTLTVGSGVDALFGSLSITPPDASGAFSAAIGTQRVFTGTRSGSTITVTPMFTAATLNGKTFAVAYPGSGKNLTKTFNADGTMTNSPGTWSINSSGQLVLLNVTPGQTSTLTLTGIANSVMSFSEVDTRPAGTANGTLTPASLNLVSLSVTPANLSLAVGTTQQYKATGTYSDNTTQDLSSTVIWASSDTAYATVSNSGLATGVAPGSTTISAKIGTISSSVTLNCYSAQSIVGVWSLDTVASVWPAQSLAGWTGWLTIEPNNTFADTNFFNGALDDYTSGNYALSGRTFSSSVQANSDASKIGNTDTLTVTLSNNNNTLTVTGFTNNPGEVDVYKRAGIPITASMISGKTIGYSFANGDTGTVVLNADGTATDSHQWKVPLTWSLNYLGQLVMHGARGMAGDVSTCTAIATAGSSISVIEVISGDTYPANNFTTSGTLTIN